MRSYKKYFFSGILIFLIIVLGLWFVLAAPTSIPSDLDFNLNSTATYDADGTVSFNWTGGTLTNFTIYISNDSGTSWFKKTWNDSSTGFLFVNTTEGNYSFKVAEVYILNASEGTNSSVLYMNVDTSAPAVPTAFDFNLNSTATYDADGTISLNWTAGGDLESNYSIYISNDSGTGWFKKGENDSVTGFLFVNTTEGNYSFKVSGVDLLGREGTNTSVLYMNVDTTDPVITHSCSPRDVYAGETITCTCTAIDGIDGDPTISFTSSPSTSDTGSYTTTCTATDSASNSDTSTISYVVGVIKSGGTVDTTTQPLQKIHSWGLIIPGVPAIIKDFDSEIGIKQIQIDVGNSAQNVKITVTKYSAKPAEVSVAKTGKVNKYLQIEATNLENKLEKGTITIQIEKSWFFSNSLDKEDIALFKFDETLEEWNGLTTTYTESDDTYNYYDVELTSFSYFAIAETEEAIVSGGQPLIGGEEGTSTWIWIVIAIVIILVVVFWQKKTKKK